MIKRLMAAALLCMIAIPAWAAMNIRQSGDGTANWQGQKTEDFGVCVGGATLRSDALLNNGTHTLYLPVPISNAVIKGAWGVAQGTSAGTSHVKIYLNGTTHAIEFVNSAGTLATDAQLTFSTASAGTVARISKVGEVSGAVRLASNTTIGSGGAHGGYVAVIANGGGTTAGASAAILIRVCPR